MTGKYLQQHKISLALAMLVVISFVFAGVFASVTGTKKSQDQRSQAATNSAVISLQPGQQDTRVGEKFTLALFLEVGDLRISAADITIDYDAGVQLEKFEVTQALPVVLRAGAINAGQRTFSIALGSGPQTPVTGSPLLVTLTFKAVSPGSNTVHFNQAMTQAAALGNTANVIGAYRQTSVTIGDQVVSPKLTIKVAQVGLSKQDVITQADIGLVYTQQNAAGQEKKLKLYKTELTSNQSGVLITKTPLTLEGINQSTLVGMTEVYLKTPYTLSKKLGSIDLKQTELLDASDKKLVIGDFDQSSEQEKNVIRLTDIVAPLQAYTLLENQLTPETAKFDVDYNGLVDIRDISIVLSSFTQLELRGEVP